MGATKVSGRNVDDRVMKAETNGNVLLARTGGYVGIGIDLPEYNLDIQGNGMVVQRIFSRDNQALLILSGLFGQIANANGDLFISNVSLSPIIFRTGDVEKIRFSPNGYIGIGTQNPNAPLQFGQNVENRKIVLYEQNNDQHQFYGFGVNDFSLRYQVNSTLSNHTFWAAIGTTQSQQLFKINGNQTVTYTPLTTAVINSLANIATGTLAYNSTLSMFVFYNGATWKRMDGITNM